MRWVVVLVVGLFVVAVGSLGSGGGVIADEPTPTATPVAQAWLPLLERNPLARRPGAEPWGNPLGGATWTAIEALSETAAWLGDSRGGLYALTIWGYMPVPSPASAEITDLAMVSPSEAWATTASGQALRWDGAAWREALALSGRFDTVSTSAAGEVWVAGHEPGVWRWDGTTWARVPSPSARYTPVMRLSALSPAGVWLAVGNNDGFSCWASVFRWNPVTQQWDALPSPGYACLSDLAVLAPDQVWVGGGYYDIRGGMLSWIGLWNGATWRTGWGGEDGLVRLDAVDDFLCAIPGFGYSDAVECDLGNYVGIPMTQRSNRLIGMLSRYDGWVMTDQLYRVRLPLSTHIPTP